MILRDGEIADTVQSHLAGAPGLVGDPFDRLVIALRLMLGENGRWAPACPIAGKIEVNHGISRRDPKIGIGRLPTCQRREPGTADLRNHAILQRRPAEWCGPECGSNLIVVGVGAHYRWN